jgi:hypothetical protein
MPKPKTTPVQPPRKRAPGGGRPPEGEGGVRVADYPRLAVRVPPATAARLRAWADVSGVPAWKLVAESVDAAVSRLEGVDATDVRRLASRYAKRYRAEGE